MVETVLWAYKKGQTRDDEQVITSTTDPEHLAKAKEWAKANGFTGFRTSVIDGKIPDFVGAINLKKKAR